MANAGTIAVTLTADPARYLRGIQVAKGSTEEFGKAFARLDSQTKRIGGNGGLSNTLNQAGSSSGNAARGFLELSRGVEDAAVVFGTSGFAGAIRASSNNLSQMAMIMGGPVAGAVAGFTAAGLSLATPWVASLFEVKDIASDIAKGLEDISNRLVTISDRNRKEIAGIIGFRQEIQGLDSVEGVNAAGKQRQNRLEVIDAEREQIQGQRAMLQGEVHPEAIAKVEQMKRNWLDLTEDQKQWVREREAAQQALHILNVQDLELTRERLKVEGEYDRLIVKRHELREKAAEEDRQRLGSDAARIIRGFQEADQKEIEQEQEREEQKWDQHFEKLNRKTQSDNDRIQGMLKSGVRGLGGKVDPLEGMRIPQRPDEWLKNGPTLKDDLRSALTDLDEFNNRKPGQLAGVATRDSQSLFRIQAQAKEAAEAKQQRQKLIERINKLIEEVKKQRPEDNDDVDLT